MVKALKDTDNSFGIMDNHERWNEYPRPMYMSSEKVLTGPERAERENEVPMMIKDMTECDDWEV